MTTTASRITARTEETTEEKETYISAIRSSTYESVECTNKRINGSKLIERGVLCQYYYQGPQCYNQWS